MRGSHVLAALAAGALLSMAPVAVASPADEGVPKLTATLAKSKSEKARIAAAVSLGRLKDERALKPLVQALKDKSHVVRAVAATALGHLGDSRALPALKRATEDPDKTVRRRAVAAIGLIRAGDSSGKPAPARRKIRSAHYRIDGKEMPRLSDHQPDLHVVIKSASDETRTRLSKKARAKRAKAMKSLMAKELTETRTLTLSAALANELKLEPYGIDLSILKLQREQRGPYVEVACEIRVAISNQRGKMISFLTGGAKVQVPRRTFRKQYESQLREEALENAVKSVHQDLIRYLRNHRPS